MSLQVRETNNPPNPRPHGVLLSCQVFSYQHRFPDFLNSLSTRYGSQTAHIYHPYLHAKLVRGVASQNWLYVSLDKKSIEYLAL